MADCLFCKIIEGDIPSTKVYEDENVIGFKDLNPQAKIHHLFIHRKHSKDINEMSVKDNQAIGEVFLAIKKYSEQEGFHNDGFRIVTNLGANAGQTVFHTHFHFLAGESLGHFGA